MIAQEQVDIPIEKFVTSSGYQKCFETFSNTGNIPCMQKVIKKEIVKEVDSDHNHMGDFLLYKYVYSNFL